MTMSKKKGKLSKGEGRSDDKKAVGKCEIIQIHILGTKDGTKGRKVKGSELRAAEREQFNGVIKFLIAPWVMCFGVAPGQLSRAPRHSKPTIYTLTLFEQTEI